MPTLEELNEKLESGEITQADIIANGWMCSVTQRISKVKQPRGGYVKPRAFTVTKLEGGGIDDLNPAEAVWPGLVGLAVDYLSRFMSGSPVRDAFSISLLGAARIRELPLCLSLLSEVKGLDDASIIAAVKIVGFDTALRAGVKTYRPVEDIYADDATIENIRAMVERSLAFFEQYGPKTMDGLKFIGGYTGYVASGDGDFLTADTLWDFKVSKKGLESRHTLQLLMYWRMGLHALEPQRSEYAKVKHLGVYNPRQNIVYRLAVDDIPADTIEEVEREVIGY